MLRLLATVLTSSLVVAQGWVDRSPANPLQTPGPRAFPAMCWDAAHGYTLLFGGQPSPLTGTQNETWSWNGTTWTRRLTTAPTAIYSWDQPSIAAMAFHTPGNQVVLFVAGSTYVWTGTDWLLHPAILPMPSVPYQGFPCNVAMAHDPISNQLVLFVGSLWANPSLIQVSQTFTWDGLAWTRRQTAFSPSPVQYPTMAFDPVANRLVLGSQGNGAAFFEWTGSNWQQRLPAGAPSAAGAFATDTTAQRLVMFDGSTNLQPGHTWTLANGSLQQHVLPLEPGPRFGAAMAFDPLRQRLVLFGGSSLWVPGQPYLTQFMGDTWELQLPAGASFVPYGTGCPGSRGVPTLAAATTSLPRVGQTFQVAVTNLPFTAPTFMFLGLSNTSYGTAPLPLDLGFLGAPACSLLASGDDLGLVTNVLGTGLWQWPTPNAPGASFYVQAFAFDAAANPLGITTSNGGHGVVGY